MRWSDQSEAPSEGELSKEYRWKLVDDFVKHFNEHQANYFNPSELICVDESMSRWYGQGGHWINNGLGTNVLKHVVLPWFGRNCIVCADSYFASVGAAKELYHNGLQFIGVIKTARRGYLKTFLTSVELQNRGDFLGLRSNATERTPELGSMVWMDWERRYFISTAGSFEAGTPYQKCRWRQVDETPNAPPEQVMLTVAQPKIAEIYFTTCGAIAKPNRLRQDDLCIKKKIETKDWSRLVNSSSFYDRC